MSLTIAIQMDPIEAIDFDGDSTFVLALEAQRRGHRLFYYLPQHLSFRQGRLTARARSLKLEYRRGAHFAAGDPFVLDLAGVDVVLMRQDPPFDMAYITATHLLEHIQPAVLVVNDPAQVRNAPEKLFVTHFPDLMPPTLITSDRAEIEAFRAEFEDIIVKPLYGAGGSGVFRLKTDDENLGSLLDLFTERSREPVIVQKYLPEIRQGDKRIILIEGEPVGAVARVPQTREVRANFHAGGSARRAVLNDRDREVCAALGPVLRRNGLVFVGIDMIGDWLTEINVTSPTGIQQINRLDGVALEARLMDAIEARRAAQTTASSSQSQLAQSPD
ncbi:MAG: glutathione synthase [Azospirillum sp.]|nr:glutathione synthase [Azospirillum sp.]